MAKYQLVSSGYLLGKVQRDFKPTIQGWHIDAYEWIGEALGIMNITLGMTTTSCKAKVKNYRLKIPCPIEALHGILFEGSKLTLVNSLSTVDRMAQLLNGYKTHQLHNYQLNPNFIHFSFQEGEVELFYDSFPLDENGLPMIPRDYKVLQALTWYVIRMLCLRGMKHPVVNFDMADSRWETYYYRAQNSMKEMTVAEREAFSRNWISLIPYLNRGDDFYSETYNLRNIAENSNLSDFLGTTIQ